MGAGGADVLVVGGGPVGLTAACELRRRGVACRIIDRLASPLQYAKAVGIQPRTLEVWEDMGIVRDALDAGIELRGQALYVNGEPRGTRELELPDSIPYRSFAFPQYAAERVLRAHLGRYGTEIEREVELTAFSQDADGVTATLSGPGGEETVRVRYLAGCDGAHSAVRKGLGLSFEGDAFPEAYMLADVELDWDQPRGYVVRAVHTRDDGAPDDGLVCVPLPGRSRYRVSTRVPPELAGSPEQPALEDIQEAIDRLSPQPATASNLRWSSVFRISHRLVDRYGDGRVFVAGDAAHIHPPTGAQGMNTGIQDAYNLAWKLALAVQGIAAPGLLESYDAERRPVGAEVVGRTVAAARTQFMTDAGDAATTMLRDAQLLVGYPDGPLGAQDCDAAAPGPQPGQRAPDARRLTRESVNRPLRLFELLATPEPVLLLYAGATVDGLEDVAAAARDAAHGRLAVYAVLAAGVDPGQLALPFAHDAGGEFADAYGGLGAYVIRPDGHVGYRAATADAGRVRAYLDRLFIQR